VTTIQVGRTRPGGLPERRHCAHRRLPPSIASANCRHEPWLSSSARLPPESNPVVENDVRRTYMYAPSLPSFQFVTTRRGRLPPYIRTFDASMTCLPSLMGSAGRRLDRLHALLVPRPTVGFANHGLTGFAITS